MTQQRDCDSSNFVPSELDAIVFLKTQPMSYPWRRRGPRVCSARAVIASGYLDLGAREKVRRECKVLWTYCSPLRIMSATHKKNPCRHALAKRPVSAKTPHMCFFESDCAAFQLLVHGPWSELSAFTWSCSSLLSLRLSSRSSSPELPDLTSPAHRSTSSDGM